MLPHEMYHISVMYINNISIRTTSIHKLSGALLHNTNDATFQNLSAVTVTKC